MRNSSTLLFSCLLSRALGGSSNRNTVSLADFCAQFQGLPLALSDVLKVAMIEFEDVGHSTSLQPVLVLLASLRPSPDLPPKLYECISGLRTHVERVTRCSDVLLSRMAANALATLQPTASAAAAWLSYISRACAAIAQRHLKATKPEPLESPAVSRHVTLGYICTATALLDAHVCSSNVCESWCRILPPSATLSQALLHALAVSSPSEAERLCLMLQSMSKFLNAISSTLSSSTTAVQAAGTAAFLSEAAHILTRRCCTPQTCARVSHSIAACVYNGRAISFCLTHASLTDLHQLLVGSSDVPSLLQSDDVSVRRAVLKHCFAVQRAAAAGFPLLDLLELLVRHLPNEMAPPLQRKCLKRVAEVLQSVTCEHICRRQQQAHGHDDSRSVLDRLHISVTSVMHHVSTLISQALQHKATPSIPVPTSGGRATLSEKTIQAVVYAAAAAAAAANFHRLVDEANCIYQPLFIIVTGSITLSDHPDVAEACAAAVGASGVMQHEEWAAKFSSCLLGLLQVNRVLFACSGLHAYKV